MSIRQKTLQTVAMAGVIALMLFLAGCGGGSGSGGDGGPPDEMPVTPEQPTTPVPVNNAYTRNDEMLGLFEQANGMDIMMAMDDDDPTTMEIDETNLDELRAAEVAQFVTRMTRSFAGIPDDGAEGSTHPDRPIVLRHVEGNTPTPMSSWSSVSWYGSDRPGTTFDDSKLRIMINPDEDGNITPLTTDYDEQGDPANFNRIDGLDDVFVHGFEIWRVGVGDADPVDQAKAIVFTDKQQGLSAIQELPAVTAEGLTSEETVSGAASFDEVNVSQDKRTIRGVTYFESATESGDSRLAYTGKLTCPEGVLCRYDLDEEAGLFTLEGYVFSGTREASDAVAGRMATDLNDYLTFGLWLYETSEMESPPDGLESFGAFAWAGGNNLGRDTTNGSLLLSTGKANYSGKAFGAHQMGGVISWFDANANLQIDLGKANSFSDNVISGEISNIRIAGADPLEHSIYLGGPYGGASTNDNDFTAVMGSSDNPFALREFTGFWDYDRFGPSVSQNPERITGTFAVTNSDDTESFLGAFATRRVPPPTP